MAHASSTVALALSLRGSDAALLAMTLEKNTPDETGQKRVYDAIKLEWICVWQNSAVRPPWEAEHGLFAIP